MKQLTTIFNIQYNVYKSDIDVIIYQVKDHNRYCLNCFSISENKIIWQACFDYYFDSINIVDGVIFVRKFNGFLVVIDLKYGNNISKKISLENFESQYQLPISDKKEIVIYEDKGELFFSGVFQIDKNKVKWLSSSIIGLTQFNGTYFGIKDRQVLSKYNSDSGLLEWQSDLSTYVWQQFDRENPSQILHVIGISVNTILVWMAGEQLLGLDVVTGEVNWKIDFAPYFYVTKFFTVDYYWDLQNNKLYLCKYMYYMEIDLATQQIKILWENPDDSYSITHCCYTDDYVYFTAFGKEINISIVGVFNRQNLKIEWLEHLTMPRIDHYSYASFNQAPQVDGNRVYFLDSTGTLHIYEKDVTN